MTDETPPDVPRRAPVQPPPSPAAVQAGLDQLARELRKLHPGYRFTFGPRSDVEESDEAGGDKPSSA
jgi:hypothetical protein